MNLDELKLEIPIIELLDAKNILGGAGSYGIPPQTLDEVIVTGERPDTSDPDKEYEEPDRDPKDGLDNQENDDQNSENEGSNRGNENNNNQSEGNQIEKLQENLNNQQKELIEKMGIKITIDPNLKEAGNYNPEDHSITLKEYDSGVLEKELIHALQDSLGILDGESSRSNAEFQEHVLGDILEFYDSDGVMGNSTVEGGDWTDFYDWLDTITHGGDESQPFDFDLFYERFEEFFESFLEHYEGTPYGQDPNENYDWNWDAFWDFLDIK